MPRCDLSTHSLRSLRCGRYGGTRTATAAGRWTSPSSTSSCALCRSRSRSSECLPLQRACRLPNPSRMHITIPARAAACTQPPVPRRSISISEGCTGTALAQRLTSPLSAALVPASLSVQARPAPTSSSAASWAPAQSSAQPSGSWQQPQPQPPIAMVGMAVHGPVPNFHPSLARDVTHTVRCAFFSHLASLGLWRLWESPVWLAECFGLSATRLRVRGGRVKGFVRRLSSSADQARAFTQAPFEACAPFDANMFAHAPRSAARVPPYRRRAAGRTVGRRGRPSLPPAAPPHRAINI